MDTRVKKRWVVYSFFLISCVVVIKVLTVLKHYNLIYHFLLVLLCCRYYFGNRTQRNNYEPRILFSALQINKISQFIILIICLTF